VSKRDLGSIIKGGRCSLSLEENKVIIRSLYEAENKQNLALLDELLAPDYVDHTLQWRGLEAVEKWRKSMTMVYKGFPDWHETVEDIIAEGDRVWVRITCTGTHTGEYRGLSPTGKKITLTSVQIWRIVNGKFVERVAVYDTLDFYKQLGVIEYKGFPDEVK